MLDTLLGIKQKMGAVYISDRRLPVTWVKVDPCVITQIKHKDKNGYEAVQLGTGTRRTKKLTKPLQNHLKNVTTDNKSPRHIKEVRVEKDSELKVGDFIKLEDVFKKGDVIAVTGISKGKGFAGVVKRWGFAGGPKTHGQSDRERAPGSIGQRTTPGRVYKGKKMAGRMGSDQITVKGLTVIDIDLENNHIAVAGAVPGKTGGLIFIKKIREGEIKIEENNPVQVKDGENIKEKKAEKANETESNNVKDLEESQDVKVEIQNT